MQRGHPGPADARIPHPAERLGRGCRGQPRRFMAPHSRLRAAAGRGACWARGVPDRRDGHPAGGVLGRLWSHQGGNAASGAMLGSGDADLEPAGEPVQSGNRGDAIAGRGDAGRGARETGTARGRGGGDRRSMRGRGDPAWGNREGDGARAGLGTRHLCHAVLAYYTAMKCACVGRPRPITSPCDRAASRCDARQARKVAPSLPTILERSHYDADSGRAMLVLFSSALSATSEMRPLRCPIW